MDDKISIPKLREGSIKLKNPFSNIVSLVPEGEENLVTHQKRFLHEELNDAFDLVTTETTPKVNYIIFMWDIEDPDRVGAIMDIQEFSPKFLLEPFVADALRKSLYSRMSLEFAEDDTE